MAFCKDCLESQCQNFQFEAIATHLEKFIMTEINCLLRPFFFQNRFSIKDKMLKFTYKLMTVQFSTVSVSYIDVTRH